MVADNLKDRVLEYEEPSDQKLMKKVPVVLALNGRGFRKTTSLLDKPFSKDYAHAMGQTLIRLASEIEGASFLYSFNDMICVVCRNDSSLVTEAWYDNNIQKIVSATASIASTSFSNAAKDCNLKLLGEPIFLCKAFTLPSITETINYLISKQHEASYTAISMACLHGLLKKYETEQALKIVKNLTIDEKRDLLTTECNIDLHDYPLSFWRGIACYRVPKTIEGKIKLKLTIDDNLPFFNKDQNFLTSILKK